MTPDRFVPVLDIIAFFLITPEILGENRISALNKLLEHPIVVSPFYAAKTKAADLLGFEVSEEDKERASSRGGVFIYAMVSMTIFAVCWFYFFRNAAATEKLLSLPIAFFFPVLIYLAFRMVGGFFHFTFRRGVIVSIAIMLFVSGRVIEIDTRWDLHWINKEHTAAHGRQSG
jgi:hypothetical protein